MEARWRRDGGEVQARCRQDAGESGARRERAGGWGGGYAGEAPHEIGQGPQQAHRSSRNAAGTSISRAACSFARRTERSWLLRILAEWLGSSSCATASSNDGSPPPSPWLTPPPLPSPPLPSPPPPPSPAPSTARCLSDARCAKARSRKHAELSSSTLNFLDLGRIACIRCNAAQHSRCPSRSAAARHSTLQ